MLRFLSHGRPKGFMDISISKNGFATILSLHSSELTVSVLEQLDFIVQKIPRKVPIALDFQNVNFICRDFFNFLKRISKKKNVSIINVNAELFALLDLTDYCKFVQVFTNEADFISNKRAIINRKFSILGNS